MKISYQSNDLMIIKYWSWFPVIILTLFLSVGLLLKNGYLNPDNESIERVNFFSNILIGIAIFGAVFFCRYIRISLDKKKNTMTTMILGLWIPIIKSSPLDSISKFTKVSVQANQNQYVDIDFKDGRTESFTWYRSSKGLFKNNSNDNLAVITKKLNNFLKAS